MAWRQGAKQGYGVKMQDKKKIRRYWRQGIARLAVGGLATFGLAGLGGLMIWAETSEEIQKKNQEQHKKAELSLRTTCETVVAAAVKKDNPQYSKRGWRS
jgi:hypothetical protein